jgi:tetratricopeptide (TPR) repeat protein
MQAERRCSQCGQVIPWGQVECPLCSPRGGFLWSLRRETFLAVILLILTVLFIATGFAAKFYHARQKALGQQWYSRGELDLRVGRAEAAVEDFRTALAYSRENARYRLRLGQALMAAGRLTEAQTYLLSLREREPGSGTVNLELAHLAVRQGSESEAVRFFHEAIYGEWDEGPAARRRAARLELAEFLLDAGDKARAQAELIALAADLPRDPQLQARVGTLLLRARAYEEALKLFRDALEESPGMEAALAGAGEACFEMYDFAGAQRYLSRAVGENPRLARAASLLETSRLVLSIDPLRRGLRGPERARRTLRAFRQALARLEDCAARRGVVLEARGGVTDLQRLYAAATGLKPRMRESVLRRDSDLVSTTLDLVFEIELATERECGAPPAAAGLDQALLLLARAQGGGRS